jgi:hypothetical protein
MTVSEADLRRMLAHARDLRGPARFAALDAVFRHADAAENTAFAFKARLESIEEFHDGGDPTRAFLAFSWCLAAHDREPGLASSHQVSVLLWAFKWVIWALPQFPDIPLDRTAAVLEDMQRRYLLHGASLHAVHQHRWLVAHHTGDEQAAQHWYDQMVTARRDRFSDCSACVPSSQVRHLAAVGRLAEAIAVGTPYKGRSLLCTEQPQWILSELLLPYTMTGRLDDAVHAHHEAYRRMRDNRHHLDNIAAHVLFCGVTGNEARGLELIERHAGWLEHPSTQFAAMEFASAAARVLRGLRDQGRGDLVVRRRSDDGARAWETTVDALHAELVGLARELALRFDERNGNTHQSSRVEQRMAMTAAAEKLPLAEPRRGLRALFGRR